MGRGVGTGEGCEEGCVCMFRNSKDKALPCL